MIIVVSKETHISFEAYVNNSIDDIITLVNDLQNHGIVCIGEKEGTIHVNSYGEDMEIMPGYALIIGHPEGIYTFSQEVITIEKLKEDFDFYDGNQFLEVLSKEGVHGLMLHPMLVNPQELYDSLSQYFDDGIKVYGMVRNNEIISVDNIEYNKINIKLTEPGFMYFIFYYTDDKLVMESITQNTLSMSWKPSLSNEWLMSNYAAFQYKLTYVKAKTNISIMIEDTLSLQRVILLLQRLGYKDFEQTVNKDRKGEAHKLTWLKIKKKKVIVSAIQGSSIVIAVKPSLNISKGKVTSRDMNVGHILTDLYYTFDDEKEVEEFFDKLLITGVKKTFNRSTVTSIDFNVLSYFTMNGDIIEDRYLSDCLDSEDITQSSASDYKIDFYNVYITNNVLMHSKNISSMEG